jgi:hypothetical protein
MRCDMCHVEGPTRYATFSKTMGFLVATSWQTVRGNLCTKCLQERYRDFTTTNALLGWWSISSFPRALIFLGANAKERRRAMSAAPLSANPTREEVKDEQVRRWRAAAEAAASRIFVWGAVIALIGVGVCVLTFVFPPQQGHKPTTLRDVLPFAATAWVIGGGTIWYAVERRKTALTGPVKLRTVPVAARARRRR